jgi:hypothetical protein
MEERAMLDDLLERYWNAAHAEGKEGRDHDTEDGTAQRTLAEIHAEFAKPPSVLFDGFAVLQALDEKAKGRTSAENVSDVLDAVVRLMRSNVWIQGRD